MSKAHMTLTSNAPSPQQEINATITSIRQLLTIICEKGPVPLVLDGFLTQTKARMNQKLIELRSS